MMNLSGKLLIATENMPYVDYRNTVVLVNEHSEQGAKGVVLNVPTDMSVMELISRIDCNIITKRLDNIHDEMVLSGGAFKSEMGFIIHTKTARPFKDTTLAKDYAITSSSDILEVLASDDENAPEHFLIVLGLTEWRAGEIEQEFMNNFWVAIEVSEQLLFKTHYSELYERARSMVGGVGSIFTGGVV